MVKCMTIITLFLQEFALPCPTQARLSPALAQLVNSPVILWILYLILILPFLCVGSYYLTGYSTSDCSDAGIVGETMPLASCAAISDDDDSSSNDAPTYAPDDDPALVSEEFCSDNVADISSCSRGGGGDDSAACFSADSTVQLESGEMKQMSDVIVGDRILVSAADGSFHYSAVVFLPHKSNAVTSSFVTLSSAAHSVRMTPAHLVLASKTCEASSIALSFASDVTVGSCLSTVDGLEVVTSVSRSTGNGIYSVVTAHKDGLVVVDGVVSSSFAVNHMIPNMFYHFHRAVSALMGSADVMRSVTAFASAVASAVSH